MNSRNCFFRAGLCFGLFLVPLFSQEEGLDLDAAAGGNIGRTAEDDGYEEPELDNQFGRLGPIEFPVAFDAAGVATIALYTPEGRLVRILAQAVDVAAQEYRIRWDGLDLFGHLVPAGSDLELKVFHNAGLRVTYEMSVTPHKVAPWPGRFERDGASRSGGWLGDHSAPNAVVAVGDRLMIGTALAEEGDNVAVITQEGEKIWGTKLQGWDGVRQLKSNGVSAFAINRRGNRVFRIEPEQRADSRGNLRMVSEELFQGSDITHIAAHGSTLLVTSANPVSRINPLRSSFGNGAIDFSRSRPLVTGTAAPTEFMISPQAAFGNTFTSAGSPQNGARMVWHNGAAYLLLVFKEPQRVGTLLLPRVADSSGVEVFVLPEGMAYEEAMSPLAGGGINADISQLRLTDVTEDWKLFGRTDAQSELNFVPASGAPVRTAAVMIKATPRNPPNGTWTPSLPLARVLAERVEDLGVQPRSLRSETLLASDESRGFGSVSGWNVRTEYPISRIYPLQMVLDYGTPQTFNGVAVFNAVNPELWVDALKPGVDPAAATEADWEELGRIRGGGTRHLGAYTASRHGYERFVALDKEVRARAVRFRMRQGYQSGKWGRGPDDSYLGENRHVALLRVPMEQAEAPTHQLHWVELPSKSVRGTWISSDYGVNAMDFSPEGQLYTVAGGRLNRSEVNPTTGALSHTPLGSLDFAANSHISLDVSANRILVGDRSRNQVIVLDRTGRELHRIGTGSGREPGPWNPYVIGRPSAVTFSASGDIWIAEELFSPKRVARFRGDGTFVEDFFGPSMYGGGGRLDPSMTRFFYRSKEYEIDLAAGTSRLLNLNDRAYHPNTVDPGTSTFAFTSMGRPFHLNGQRYLVDGFRVVRKPDDSPVWLPAMVAGPAHESPFLLGKDVWNRHWAQQDLSGKFFLWTDLNGDGAYQVDEVQLIDLDKLPDMRGPTWGPNLQTWGRHFRWAPRRFTDAGVPVFDFADITPFDYDQLAPIYHRNYTLGGPRSAKPGYSGMRYISTDGHLAQEAQPFVVKPDGTLLGGPAPQEPSDYVPPIVGQVVQTAWSWAGGGMTNSDVGEIAVINSFRGAWHLWAVKHGVMVGRIFTGEEGTLNGMEPVRGTDITRRYFGWEGWHADFVKGHDGNFYAQGGKSFHSISRVHGMDDFRITVTPHRVTPDAFRQATALRSELVNRARASRGRSLDARPANIRLGQFRLDGELDDWGNRRAFTFLDDDTRTTRFDMSYTDEGILIAIDGNGNLDGGVDDWRQAIHQGFAIDLQFRGGRGNARGGNPMAGDSRILIVKHKGQWRGVLTRPLHPDGPRPSATRFTSPVLDLHMEELRLLEPRELAIHVSELTLDLDLGNMDLGGGVHMGRFGDLGAELAPRGGDDLANEKRGDGQDWSAELMIPWSLIGGGPGVRRLDIGIREAGPQGRRLYWNNRHPYGGSDPALQADLNPAAWGTVNFANPPRR